MNGPMPSFNYSPLSAEGNGIYKKKEFHGRGVKIVNMGELFTYPRLLSMGTDFEVVERGIWAR